MCISFCCYSRLQLIGFSLIGGGTAVLVADKIAGDELGDLLVKVADIAKSIGLSDVDDSEVDKDQLVADVMCRSHKNNLIETIVSFL